jgi:hypothetical protein
VNRLDVIDGVNYATLRPVSACRTAALTVHSVVNRDLTAIRECVWAASREDAHLTLSVISTPAIAQTAFQMKSVCFMVILQPPTA